MIETKPKKRLPKFITEDFDISEELNDIKIEAIVSGNMVHHIENH